jgi:hypothetical protein
VPKDARATKKTVVVDAKDIRVGDIEKIGLFCANGVVPLRTIAATRSIV